MIENTLKNKAKFRAQYHGQEVWVIKRKDGDEILLPVGSSGGYGNWSSVEYDYLELTPLSNITDEDAIEVMRFWDFNIDDPIQAKSLIWQFFLIDSNDPLKDEFILKQMLFKLSDISSTVDKFRKWGYAYEYDGLSVEELIQRGWIKLRES